jgi:hypothetical protein
MDTAGDTKLYIRREERPPIELLGENIPVMEPWPTTAVAALEWSIQKWEYIVKILEAGGIGKSFFDRGYQTCALCQLYGENHGKSDECYGCPVAHEVNCTGCGCTPWILFSSIPSAENAKAELDFLKGLRQLAKDLDDGTVKPTHIEIEED